MAIGWLAVLQSVPWSEVIGNAPKVADGAKKLWNAATKKSSSAAGAGAGTQPVADAEPQTLAELATRTTAMAATISDLQAQMLSSSELIKALAEQNAQLVQRIESNRVRLLWLALASGAFAIATGFMLFR